MSSQRKILSNLKYCIDNHEKQIKAYRLNIATATEVAKLFEEKGNTQVVDEIRQYVSGYAMMELQLKDRVDSLNAIVERIKRNPIQEEDDYVMDYEQYTLNAAEERQGHEEEMIAGILKDYRLAVWSVNHPDEPLPEDADEDIVMLTQTKIDAAICPLTKAPFVDAQKNSKCPHVFSKQAILSYLRTNRRCPVAGCNATLSPSDLTDDIVATRNAQRMKKRARESSDSESVEEL
eukprot:TRINITY_DN13429_c0_g1_i1.p1 TRINITY_DN13429_c0_g1~~TRINITY_DN13429_c0_g1_i1.p1  ORF type:complete len:243 (+),score=62.98 TRINITY_DN13429_c0_g1_i1:28-729(+)